ncbi:fumarylacetoacetate hydrolase family protein [Herbiconiux sp. VKM Ac-1786]|uniref:fumarylacetoacetate hydrolase family protein n=1 Tax=Herbiconiux sp. VKM Ac-1786 TaxID=2783824 RepID=UPI00188AACBA|nr:fumarylacetoacetate hydrolase family protein [Herbiconiux sp. VKM Ac-1786]MBF4571847.1 fumarylacetoacetate hydrolase family protein [Herbiconiux sp. VKM Ac-1786]
MRLATLRTPTGTVAVRIDNGTAVELGVPDIGALLARDDWKAFAAAGAGPAHPLNSIERSAWAPVVPAPSKIVCVGLNYRSHILEMGRELPEYPTLFAKYPEAVIGPYDPIVLPAYAAQALDWEGELAIVIGAAARRLDRDAAALAIAGYSVMNDLTMRDYQYRTPEWFQGKSFEKSAPFGPVLVTADDYGVDTELRTEVDGEVVQSAITDDLVFDPAALVSYISQIFTLNPGDVIASGTPGGVGHARKPPRYLVDGNSLSTSVEGIGTLVNQVIVEGD